jgi:hypothetical protein
MLHRCYHAIGVQQKKNVLCSLHDKKTKGADAETNSQRYDELCLPGELVLQASLLFDTRTFSYEYAYRPCLFG